MRFVVLTSKPDSPYADTSTSYEYPAQYRRYFEPLAAGEQMLAIIYEPLARGAGRMAYVGWAALGSLPIRSTRPDSAGRPLWVVQYTDRVQELPTPVSRDVLGEPIERWLRDIDPEHRAVRTSGASVRFIEFDDAQRILELGYAGELRRPDYPTEPMGHTVAGSIAERATRLVVAVQRDAAFRRQVMSAYGFRCSVSGFGIGELPLGRATRLIDAAHIRPVSHNGSDAISNGLALTPTLHRLFDEGLFTIRTEASDMVIVTSPSLEPTMIMSPDRTFRLPLETGLKVQMPQSEGSRPSADQIRFHQRQIFKGPDSLVR